MNNEPVAWMFQGAFDISTYVSFEKPNPDIYPNPTPLYTHPAKTQDAEQQSYQDEDGCPTEMAVLKRFWRNHQTAKTLTDEEIDDVLYSMDWAHDPVEFAKAILRKAQEK